MLKAVDKHAPWCSRSVRAWYAGANKHIVETATGNMEWIHADRGVDQGCPLGPFLFAVAIREACEDILAEARARDDSAEVLFYLDDGYIVVAPEHASHIYNFLKARFEHVGLHLNTEKTQAWTLRPETMPMI